MSSTRMRSTRMMWLKVVRDLAFSFRRPGGDIEAHCLG